MPHCLGRQQPRNGALASAPTIFRGLAESAELDAASAASVPIVTRTVIAVAGGYAAAVAALSLLRYEVFASDFDHGIWTQYVWLLGHLRDPFNTIDLRTLFADHVEPGLVLLAPLGTAGIAAPGLLIVQALALAATAPLLFVLARTNGATRWVAALPALLWCASPVIFHPALQDFHPETLVAPVLVAGCIALTRGRTGWFLVSAALACSFREDVALTYAGFGALLFWMGRRGLGAALAAASIVWGLIAAFVILRAFGNAGQQEFGPRFAGYRGRSVGDVLHYIAAHPFATVNSALTPNDIGIVVLLIATTGGLCVLAPRWLVVAVPATAFNLLSADPLVHTIDYHYWIVQAAAVAVAGAVGAGRVSARTARSWLWGATVTGCFISFLTVDWANSIVDQIRYEWPRRADRAAVIASIPATASVAAPMKALPHLAERTTVYVLPEPLIANRKGTLWGATQRAEAAHELDYILFDPGLRVEGNLTDAQVERAIVQHGFREVMRRGETRLYRRRSL